VLLAKVCPLWVKAAKLNQEIIMLSKKIVLAAAIILSAASPAWAAT